MERSAEAPQGWFAFMQTKAAGRAESALASLAEWFGSKPHSVFRLVQFLPANCRDFVPEFF